MSYLFKGGLLKLKTVNKRLPNGRMTRLELIEHPGAALIIPFLTKDTMIFIRQFRPAVSATLYELPAGTLEKGERPVVCAKRELREETGYQGKFFRRIADIYPVPGYSTEVITLFEARGLKEGTTAAEPDEIIKTFCFSRAQVKALFRRKMIVDAKTLCALAYAGWI